MSAKNGKPSKPHKGKRSFDANRSEAEFLVWLLKGVMTDDKFRELEERILDPEKASEAQHKEEEARRMEEFVGSISGISAGYRLPAGFSKMWDLLIDIYEQDIRKRYIEPEKSSKHIDVIVRRGWVTVNPEKSRLESHLKRPPDALYPIPAVLINDAGKWELPIALSMLIKAHPFVRKFTKTLPDHTKRELIAETIKWAESCRPENPDDNHHGTILAQSAEQLDLFLYEQAFGDPAEFGWMHAAKQSQQFWDILDAAIGFGRSLQNHEIYGDGSMELLIQRALVLSKGKLATEWRQFIERELTTVLRATGKIMTPAELREHLGSKLPDAKDEPMIFTDSRCVSLPPITWPEFQIRAKKARQKLDL